MKKKCNDGTEIDQKAAVHPGGPSELQFDEIEDLKTWGLMDAEGRWVPVGTKLPPYKRKFPPPVDAPVYSTAFSSQLEAANCAESLARMTDVKHKVLANPDGTFSIAQDLPT